MSEAAFQLTGSNAYAARFGETVVDLGDLDDDGYSGTNHSNTTRPHICYIFTRKHGSNSHLVLITLQFLAFKGNAALIIHLCVRFLTPPMLFSEENYFHSSGYGGPIEGFLVPLLQHLAVLLHQFKPRTFTFSYLQKQHQ